MEIKLADGEAFNIQGGDGLKVNGQPVGELDLSDYAKKEDVPYALIEVPLKDSINLTDRAINKVTADDSVSSVTFIFPNKVKGKARDFFIRLEITGNIIPTFSFVEPNGDAVSFDVDDDSWAEIEQGVNILMFTDTGE